MSVLISREDAKRAVLDELTNDATLKEIREKPLVTISMAVVKALNALPSAESEWIPCSERLPKEKQEVYVTVYFIEGDTGRAYGYMDRFGRWHLYSTVEGTLNSGYEVTAWMPLPPSYRGK